MEQRASWGRVFHRLDKCRGPGWGLPGVLLKQTPQHSVAGAAQTSGPQGTRSDRRSLGTDVTTSQLTFLTFRGCGFMFFPIMSCTLMIANLGKMG